MFSLGWGEILVLAGLGLLIFGPEKLPQVIKEARGTVRDLIHLARSAKDDLQAELGPEMADLDLASLHPRRLVNDFVFGDDDDDPLIGNRKKARRRQAMAGRASAARPAAGRLASAKPLAPGERPPWDIDAT